MRHIAIGKGVHILDEDALRREVLENHSQGTADIGTDETNNISDLYCEVLLLQNLIGLVGLRHDTTENAEIGIVGNTHGGKVNACCTEGFSHFGQTAGLVLEEYG